MPSVYASLMTLAEAERFRAAEAARQFIASAFLIPVGAVVAVSVPWDCERRLFDVQVAWNYPGDECLVFGTGGVLVKSPRYEILYDMSLHSEVWAKSYVDTAGECEVVEQSSDWE